MKLPNPSRAVIDGRKIRDYLLSPTHPLGRSKAAYFAELGFTQADWQLFAAELLQVAAQVDVIGGKFSRFGNKFEISAKLTGPIGTSAWVLTVWIVRHGEDFPRFVTALPGDKP